MHSKVYSNTFQLSAGAWMNAVICHFKPNLFAYKFKTVHKKGFIECSNWKTSVGESSIKNALSFSFSLSLPLSLSISISPSSFLSSSFTLYLSNTFAFFLSLFLSLSLPFSLPLYLSNTFAFSLSLSLSLLISHPGRTEFKIWENSYEIMSHQKLRAISFDSLNIFC